MSYQEIKSKYPNKTPVIVTKTNLNINKRKYLLDYNMTVGEFLYFIRNRTTNLNSSTGLFLFVYNGLYYQLPIVSDKLSKYEKNDFIKVEIRKENIYG